MASFLEDFFGNTGTGSSLVSGGLQIGLSAVKNRGDEIRGAYQVELTKLNNDHSLSEEEFQLQLAKLSQNRDAALAQYNDQKRNDTITIVAIVGALVTIVIVTVLLVIRQNPHGSSARGQA